MPSTSTGSTRTASLDAWVTLVYAFNVGIEVDRLFGVDTGHRELLQSIDRWLESHEAMAR